MNRLQGCRETEPFTEDCPREFVHLYAEAGFIFNYPESVLPPVREGDEWKESA